MSEIESIDTMPRDAKIFFDDGTAPTAEAAVARLQALRLRVEIGPEAARTYTGQVALLTIVNSAVRTFRGGVHVVGLADAPLRFPSSHASLLDAVLALGALLADCGETPTIAIGSQATAEFGVSLHIDGVCGGVTPLDMPSIVEESAFVPAVVFSAALAVCEIFEHYRGSVMACRRSAGLNLWSPDSPYRTPARLSAPARLPEALWLAGLGHLGQAYLWAISMLPYSDRSKVQLYMQDYDVATTANLSTGLLTEKTLGEYKTRLCAKWMEQRGFNTRVIEQAFGPHTRRGPDDPNILIAGFDKATPRRALLDPGFDFAVDAGLGSRPGDFTGFSIFTLPGTRTPDQLWPQGGDNVSGYVEDLRQSPNYEAHAQASGMDQCGMAQFAGTAVGASFVGAATAAVTIAQVIRRVNGQDVHAFIDGDLRALEYATSAVTQPATLKIFANQGSLAF